ncbi:AP-3 complex subunit mu-1 [Aduncisulcus paluster]|uniref:AP-3 complex subunit mu-1 n=1 Tax=Aduncisulcus paluster TaxID=2918883 RepID=A0ABQ5K551_9EUKA|nr:AP-3 complex subunit mu-1 [Aduncisulcus paluster]
MIKSIFVVDSAQNVIAERHFFGVIDRSILTRFFESDHRGEPIIELGANYVIPISVKDVQFIAITDEESSPMMVITFLHRISGLARLYFDDVTAKVLKDNFITVYQLIDEICDGGHPMNTEPNVISTLVDPTSRSAAKSATEEIHDKKLPTECMTAIPWRGGGITHSRNNVYFDIVENVDAVIDSSGVSSSASVRGHIDMKCNLSGTPDLLLEFSDPSALSDCCLHPCVRLKRFEEQKVVSFIPPDGVSRLLSYRSARMSAAIPFYTTPTVMWNGKNKSGRLKLSCGTRGGYEASGVTIRIPMGEGINIGTVDVNTGKTAVDIKARVLEWKVGSVSSDLKPELKVIIENEEGEGKPKQLPVASVRFSCVQKRSLSGLHIRKLTLSREKYKFFKGVKYIIRAGKFEVRF